MIALGDAWPGSRWDNTAYGFIDADNMRLGLRQLLSRHGLSDDEIEFFDLKKLFQNAPTLRNFFYSAVTFDDGAPEWIREIRAEPRFIFRSGVLREKTGKRKQEGVDVLLALDAVRHAYKRNMGACLIFSDDGDLLPLVEALVSEGVRTITCGFGNPEKSDVAARFRDASDQYIRVGYWILHECMNKPYRIVSRAGARYDLTKEAPKSAFGEPIVRNAPRGNGYEMVAMISEDQEIRWLFSSEAAATAWSKLFTEPSSEKET